MATPIVIWPARVLTRPTRAVTEFGAKLQPLLDEMLESVREAQGIGIAATQIGVDLRVALVGREDGEFFEIVNPEVLERSEPVSLVEGCLSVPDEFEPTPRHRRVRVRFWDKDGQPHELAAEDRLAHVLQHEIDHLDGVVFVTHLSTLKRDLIRKKMRRRKRAEAEE